MTDSPVTDFSIDVFRSWREETQLHLPLFQPVKVRGFTETSHRYACSSSSRSVSAMTRMSVFHWLNAGTSMGSTP